MNRIKLHCIETVIAGLWSAASGAKLCLVTTLETHFDTHTLDPPRNHRLISAASFNAIPR